MEETDKIAESGGTDGLIEHLLNNYDRLVDFNKPGGVDAPNIPPEDTPVRQTTESTRDNHVSQEQPVGCQTLQESRKRKPNRLLTETYWNEHHRRFPEFTCQHCGNKEAYDDHLKHGDTVCTKCGTCFKNGITDDAFKNMNFGDYRREKDYVDASINKNVYERSNYFANLLSQLTGRKEDHNKIPNRVYEAVKHTLKGTKREEDIDGPSVRAALKRNRMGRYYEYSFVIANRLTKNRSLLVLDHMEEEILMSSFQRMQITYENIKNNRKNLLSYSYVMFQLFRLIYREDLCRYVDMLRCKKRLAEHDRIWKHLCGILGWKFRPVVTEYST